MSPFPSKDLYPSPDLYPGSFLPPSTKPLPFAALLQSGTEVWNDVNGFWETYNSAIATMFEAVYDFVSDQGDPNQSQIAVLDDQLWTTLEVTQLSVQSVGMSVPAGTEITLILGENQQTFVTSSDLFPGWGSIPIDAAWPNFNFPIGTPVQLAWTPGWSALLDPYDCPALFYPYLAQFNGTDVPVGLDAQTAQSKIIGESAQHRGTLAAVKAAVKRNLTGTQSVTIQERTDFTGAFNAYWFVVIVNDDEIVDEQALTDAVNAIKPGGVMWSLGLHEATAWTITVMEGTYETVTYLEGDYQTLSGLETQRPDT